MSAALSHASRPLRAALSSTSAHLLRAAPTPAGRAASAANSKKKATTAIGGDSRYPLLKDYLLAPHSSPATAVTDASATQHATIERAWAVANTARTAELAADRSAKYARVRAAMLALEAIDPSKLEMALGKEGEDMYFPRLMKAPTLTPGKPAWDYRDAPLAAAAAAA
ncbi:hypothetical protein BC828DRAFT_376657, partial [Blastocladiella britannica]